MPLIRNGTVEESGTDAPSLEDFLAAARSANDALSVRLTPDDDPADLAPHIDRITLIEISFPKYTDGRGYSQAQLLRRRLGYSGELRAVGHVLRDQIFYMHRSGFDAYETTRADLSSVMEALKEFTHAYQPAAGDIVPIFRKRQES